MRDSFAKFEQENIAVYALSYDDQEVLGEFSEKQRIPYILLSDIDSKVIRQYGLLNEQVDPGDAVLYGIPYPGVYLCDEQGVVVGKSFHDTYKKRDSPELLLDVLTGKTELDETLPLKHSGDDEIKITAAIHGGNGSLRQGVIRHLLVRFELAHGLHLYGKPVAKGMRPLEIEVNGPPGLVIERAEFPPTRSLHLAEADLTLPVWEGTFDVRIPIYPVGELASEVRPLDSGSVDINIEVRFQACDSNICLLPKQENITITAPLDVIDIPAISLHKGHGQREGTYDGTPHLKRLLFRKIRQHPLGFFRYILKSMRLERAARRRKEIQQSE